MPWWQMDDWARMVSGTECPMCDDAHLPSNAHSDLITASDAAFTRLHRNQTHAGYGVVILKRHAAELQELADEEHAAFWRDVRALSRAVAALFQPVKIDTMVMGHLCPHVHCHVYPQYQSDDPHALVDFEAGVGRLSDGEQAARVIQIRSALRRAPQESTASLSGR